MWFSPFWKLLKLCVSVIMSVSMVFALAMPRFKSWICWAVTICLTLLMLLAGFRLYLLGLIRNMGVLLLGMLLLVLWMVKPLFLDGVMQWCFGIMACANAFCVILHISSWLESFCPSFGPAGFIFSVLLAAGTAALFHHKLRPRYAHIAAHWVRLLLLPLVLLTAFTSTLVQTVGPAPLLLSGLAICIYVSLCWMMDAMLAEQRLLTAAEQSSRQQILLLDELGVEREFVIAARRARHDLRHHDALLLELLEREQVEAAREYLQSHVGAISAVVVMDYCDNTVVNALLRITARRCEAGRIAFQAAADVPARLPLSPEETGRLFGNLLENACEACAHCRAPSLYFWAEVRSDTLYVEVRNSVVAPVLFRDGWPITTKKDGGGIGVGSMQDILDKNGGMLNFDQKDGMFTSQILLPLDDPPWL